MKILLWLIIFGFSFLLFPIGPPVVVLATLVVFIFRLCGGGGRSRAERKAADLQAKATIKELRSKRNADWVARIDAKTAPLSDRLEAWTERAKANREAKHQAREERGAFGSQAFVEERRAANKVRWSALRAKRTAQRAKRTAQRAKRTAQQARRKAQWAAIRHGQWAAWIRVPAEAQRAYEAALKI